MAKVCTSYGVWRSTLRQGKLAWNASGVDVRHAKVSWSLQLLRATRIFLSSWLHSSCVITRRTPRHKHADSECERI